MVKLGAARAGGDVRPKLGEVCVTSLVLRGYASEVSKLNDFADA